MVSVDEMIGCCGIGVLVDIVESRTSEDTIKEFCEYVYWDYEHKYNLMVFTDAVKYKKGTRLAAYIIKNKLGEVVESPHAAGLHGHAVSLWTWKVDWKALEKWAKKHGKSESDAPEYDDEDDNLGYNW
jgi:hypothetical protein